jgi:hypothetical protein
MRLLSGYVVFLCLRLCLTAGVGLLALGVARDEFEIVAVAMNLLSRQ